ncbi:MAG: hypothetical protein SFY81_00975 [Verrucomicrobiota bacterium]|nr:hypothetical protein [Verrucomicrobiota bacterium]
MKKNKLVTGALLGALLTFATTSAHALTTAQAKAVRKAVTSVSVKEMPAKAAELVLNADKKDREAVAVTAVKTIVFKHRAAAPVVVTAISKAAPDLASVVAAAATEVAESQAVAIATAAIAAAPAQQQSVQTAVNSTAARVRSAANGSPSSGTVNVSNTAISGSPFPGVAPTPSSNSAVDYAEPRD